MVPDRPILSELLGLFVSRMGSLFPSLTPRSIPLCDESSYPLSSPQVSDALLLNSICAVAARFSTSPSIKRAEPSRTPATYGIPFADKAKQLLIPLLGYPSSSTVAALVLLAYHEFGLNSEPALWMYSGMAMRMAVDLGLHLEVAQIQIQKEGQQCIYDKLLWWSCLLLDRTLAIGTGRSGSVKDNEITVRAMLCALSTGRANL